MKQFNESKPCKYCGATIRRNDFRYIYHRMTSCGSIECKKKSDRGRMRVYSKIPSNKLRMKEYLKKYRGWKEKKCKVCKNKIVNNNRVYCSSKCREFWYANRDNLINIQKLRNKKCVVCGKQFDAGKKTSRTCSDGCAGKNYVLNNPEKASETRRKRRARINKIIETFTIDQIKEKLKKYNGVCLSCNKFVGEHKLTLDHIHPIAKAEEGRIYGIDDIQFLCKSCNCSKHTRVIV